MACETRYSSRAKLMVVFPAPERPVHYNHMTSNQNQNHYHPGRAQLTTSQVPAFLPNIEITMFCTAKQVGFISMGNLGGFTWFLVCSILPAAGFKDENTVHTNPDSGFAWGKKKKNQKLWKLCSHIPSCRHSAGVEGTASSGDWGTHLSYRACETTT